MMQRARSLWSASRGIGVACAVLGTSALACSGEQGGSDAGDTDPIADDGDPDDPTVDEEPGKLNATYASLDLSFVDSHSGDYCRMPTFSPDGFVDLNQDMLANLLSEYTVGWMTPLHQGIGTLDEANLFKASFELVWASFDTGCNWNTDEDLTFGDTGLLDDESREEARSEVLDFIRGGVQVSAGQTLRLQFHDCPQCDEPLGAQPFFVNAQLTNDGVLSISVELFEGQVSQTVYVTPDAVVVQSDLAAVFSWLQQISARARSGDELWPDASGTMTAIARKTEAGMSTSIGLSESSFDSLPGDPDNVTFSTTAPCIGMQAAARNDTGGVQTSAYLGGFGLTVPGHINCDSPDCGTLETTQLWTYTASELSLTADQPDSGATEALAVTLGADSSAQAQLGTETFAQWQVGSERSDDGGAFAADVDVQEEGYLVTFRPALNMRGAMTISKFSDHFQATLPDWLEDELFDVTFGGDPTASVFVPKRQMCNPDPFGEDPPEPARREVQIVSGNLDAEVASGVRSATAGQCVGATLLDESQLSFTSDWAEIGFVCE